MSEAAAPIPARAFPTSARAPGKCVLFGEHAVVHGAPELVVAVDLHTQVIVREAARTTLNSDALAAEENPYLREALAAGPASSTFEVRAVSRVPRAAGLGSSAAFVAAFSGALAAGWGGLGRSELAQRCFVIERSAQGGLGSPGDTSAAVAGGYVTLNAGEEAGPLLWRTDAADRSWDVRRAADPGWVWVVAYSGVPRSTATAVAAVAERLRRPDGPELLRRFSAVARDGILATAQGDRATTGQLMDQNQELLREVGVSHPRLEALLAAARPDAEGAKLTGAGCGGSIVALPKPGHEVQLARRLARAGAVPFPVRAAPGVELVDGPPVG